ncbi:S-adenosyl-L-methionine-dependent methyltransferase [Choiromyces venosus 120613-1]|uniref:S-adenosyl-L-methionine-dependent methyltransferase n=1 Tax=Choiromyces venosus 120613-1 TaxID=1336337 RepID=A0A3N4JKR8_9PEZI|nr:S-adenosyl-L-methionine-dependent methyltransferase [Choiromyces venosus 120613-1]
MSTDQAFPPVPPPPPTEPSRKSAHQHQQIWDANAKTWDSAIGTTGNSFYKHLISPTVLTLLSPQPDENMLELACGNGIFARKLAELGSRVLATDFSENMVGIARERTGEEVGKRVWYMRLDVTSERELDGLVALAGRHLGFDGVVCNMALMDISTLEPLANALPRLLKRNGRFVVTIMHPAFNSSGTHRHIAVAEDPITGRIGSLYSINVNRYLSIPPTKGEAIPGQPKAQHYFHRPLHEILSVFFKNGLVMDGLLEPAFSGEKVKSGKELSWQNYSQVPPVLGFRLRKLLTD